MVAQTAQNTLPEVAEKREKPIVVKATSTPKNSIPAATITISQ